MAGREASKCDQSEFGLYSDSPARAHQTLTVAGEIIGLRRGIRLVNCVTGSPSSALPHRTDAVPLKTSSVCTLLMQVRYGLHITTAFLPVIRPTPYRSLAGSNTQCHKR